MKRNRVFAGRRQGRTFVSLAIGLAGSFGIFTSAQANTSIGRNAAVKGDVTLESIGEEARRAVLQGEVRLGDRVDSATESSLQILLLDSTVFTVGPSAKLTIDEFVYKPGSDESKMSARMKKGVFRFMSGGISRSAPQNVDINTPISSLGIRGTIAEGLVGTDAIALAQQLGLIEADERIDYDCATLVVLRGPGPDKKTGINQRGTITATYASGTRILSEPGEAFFIQNKDIEEPKVFTLSDEGFEVFNDLLRTRPNGPGTYSPFSVPISSPEEENLDILIDDYNPLIDLDWPN